VTGPIQSASAAATRSLSAHRNCALTGGGFIEAGTDLQGLTVYLSTAGGEPVALPKWRKGSAAFRVFNFGQVLKTATNRKDDDRCR